MMSKHKEKLCSCGFPQSEPIPHEHDQTDREKVIVEHFEKQHKGLLKALEEITSYSKNNKQESIFNRMGWRMQEIAGKAIEKAEGK